MTTDRRLKVLCLHGHPGSSKAMQIFVQHFQKLGIEAFAPDLRGYGNCRVKSAFTMLDHIHDLCRLLDHNAQDSTSDNSNEYLILGWSLGGILAIELALHQINQQSSHPKIAGLILIATAAKPRSNLPPITWWEYLNLAIALLLHQLSRNISKNKQALPKIVKWFGKHSLLKYLIQQHHPTAYNQITDIGIKAYLQTSTYAHQALQKALRQGYDRTGDLSKIHTPCLIITADQDRHITSASTTETANLIPNSQLIKYPNTAHLLPWEIENQILADIDKWCQQHFNQLIPNQKP
ncbi:MAG: alpha/beta hydrolase [Pseudanabaenaceae cyanobacterium bins.39]|nr:alpha/beta hydrolase [Pseudanabaenaceae cyanobacterium bins.39]